MQVNGWVLGLGAAITMGSIAQAQIAPRTGADARLMQNPEIAALRAEIASLKADLDKLKTHNHCLGIIGGNIICEAKFGPSNHTIK